MPAGPTTEAPRSGVDVLVGGVGQLYQGDLDLGRHAIEALAGEDLGRGVRVEDLHYGAVAVVQRLQELRPAALILVGAAPRGRAPGSVHRRSIEGVDLPPSELQRAVGEAVTGYVTVDLLIEVAFALEALPARTVTIEAEPVLQGPGERLSPPVAAALGEVSGLVCAEVALLEAELAAGERRVAG